MDKKLYVAVPQGTGWLEEILVHCPQVLDTEEVLILKTMGGDLLYMVDVEMVNAEEMIEYKDREVLSYE